MQHLVFASSHAQRRHLIGFGKFAQRPSADPTRGAGMKRQSLLRFITRTVTHPSSTTQFLMDAAHGGILRTERLGFQSHCICYNPCYNAQSKATGD